MAELMRSAWWLGLMCGVLASFATVVEGCIVTPAGCNALESSDDCSGSEQVCESDHNWKYCVRDGCGAEWRHAACPFSPTPYCVQVGASKIECAKGPGCASTLGCERDGDCGESPGGCSATAEGCAASTGACAGAGKCGFADGFCVATAVGCEKSTLCRQSGLCGFAVRRCAPTAESCAASDDCRKKGLCDAGPETCIASEEGCAKSEVCVNDGHCRLRVPCATCAAYCGL